MTPATFAALMNRAYTDMRPWSVSEIERTINSPHTVFLTHEHGGLIARIVAGECEILSIATDPNAQRTGVGSALLADLITVAQSKNADRIFLEVASRNAPARAFYGAKGFAQISTRRGYYTLRDGAKDDAFLLSRPLSPKQGPAAPTS